MFIDCILGLMLPSEISDQKYHEGNRVSTEIGLLYYKNVLFKFKTSNKFHKLGQQCSFLGGSIQSMQQRSGKVL